MIDPLDKRMWRKVLAAVHPDAGGDEELFKFLNEVREHVQQHPEPARPEPGPRSWPGPVVVRNAYGSGSTNGFHYGYIRFG